MAKPGCAVNFVNVACIDPNLETVTSRWSRYVAFSFHLLTGDANIKKESFLVPGSADIGKWLLFLQLAKVGQTILLTEFYASFFPGLISSLARHLESKQQS